MTDYFKKGKNQTNWGYKIILDGKTTQNIFKIEWNFKFRYLKNEKKKKSTNSSN